MKITIVYWSGTGNTEEMANLIYDGAKGAGAEVTIKQVGAATVDDVNSCDILVLGCPATGTESLEESEFEPYIDLIESKITGKKMALFGSHDWGDGQWMRDWTDRMKKAGANLVCESLIVQLAPEGADAESCKTFGANIVK